MGLHALLSGNQTVLPEHQYLLQAFSMHFAFLAGLTGLYKYYPKPNTIRLSPAKGGPVALALALPVHLPLVGLYTGPGRGLPTIGP